MDFWQAIEQCHKIGYRCAIIKCEDSYEECNLYDIAPPKTPIANEMEETDDEMLILEGGPWIQTEIGGEKLKCQKHYRKCFAGKEDWKAATTVYAERLRTNSHNYTYNQVR